MIGASNGRSFRVSQLILKLTAIGVGIQLAAHSFAGGPPANDDCADKITIGLGETPFTTEGATAINQNLCGPVGKDIWYRFDSTFKGFLEVSTCGDANFDTVIGVYNGCSCSGTTLLACSDENLDCDDHTSKTSLAVDPGKCYRIRVAGFQGDSGLGVLSLGVLSSENAAIAHRTLTGAEELDRFGTSVAGNAQFNVDDFRDVLVGAPRNDVGGADIGRAYAYTGSDQEIIYTKTGAAAGDQFGYSVAVADVNDDGRHDLIVGAPYNDTVAVNAGRVYAYSGLDGSLLWEVGGQFEGDRFGFRVDSAGDANEDGIADVVVGAPYYDVSVSKVDAGRAYVLDGQDGSILSTRNGAEAGDLFGWAVAGIGDLNDDGNDDFAVGAPRNDVSGSDSGRAYLCSGADGSVIHRINGSAAGDRFGTSVAGRRFSSGGSQWVLVAVGAPYNDASFSNAGRVRVYQRNITTPGQSGCSAPICHKWTINGGKAGDLFGSSVAVGDLVSNSFADVIVGAPKNDLNGSSSGAVYVLNGSNGTLIKRFFGEAPGDQFGASVAIAGDVNDDGEADLIVGAPYNDAGGDSAGRAYTFFFNTGSANMVALATDPGIDLSDESEMTIDDGEGDTSPVKPADVNLDGAVNGDDVAFVVQAWGDCPKGGMCPADLNGDDQVNVDDLLAVIETME